MMDDLVTWLKAQVAEDERLANAEDADYAHTTLLPTIDSGHQANWETERVRREIEAKRRLIDQVMRYEAKIDSEWGCCCDPSQIAAGECPETSVDKILALRLLALPFSDRPGYREEWAL